MNNVIVSNAFEAGVYLTKEECSLLRSTLIDQRQQIDTLETQIEKLIKEQQDDVTGVGQC